VTISRATLWIRQAQSDANTAEAIASRPGKLDKRDVGCHVALLCAQSLEKSVKGCLLLVGVEAPLNHDVADKIDTILSRLLKGKGKGKGKLNGPVQHLKALFEERGLRPAIAKLRAWTPGAATCGEPNYEYPWPAHAETQVPTGHVLFEDPSDHFDWVLKAKSLSDGAAKVAEAMRRYPPL
jgi:hypothetical protein